MVWFTIYFFRFERVGCFFRANITEWDLWRKMEKMEKNGENGEKWRKWRKIGKKDKLKEK